MPTAASTLTSYPSQVAWNVDGKPVQVGQHTDFPASDTTLTIQPTLSLRFRYTMYFDLEPHS